MTPPRRHAHPASAAIILLAVMGVCVTGCVRVDGPGPEPPDPRPSGNVAHEAVVTEARMLAGLCRRLADKPPETEAELGTVLTEAIKGLRDEAFAPVGKRIGDAFPDGYNREAARAVLMELATGFERVK